MFGSSFNSFVSCLVSVHVLSTFDTAQWVQLYHEFSLEIFD